MVPNVSRGFSFGGVTAYLMHDKREEGLDSDSAERVGFVELLNFDDGEARTPVEAAKVMALTVRDADRLKQGAGVKATGNKAQAPPVFHMSLSWTKTEQVDRAEMMRAMSAALAAPGLHLAKGYQTFCVEHTDTEHQHLHVVVNLVHPITGKQANPHRDQPKLQAWARDYERQRGQVFCHDREAKHAAIDKKRGPHSGPTRAAFNGKAQGEAGRRPAVKPESGRAGGERPARRVPYHVWQAQQQANSASERAAAERVKVELGGRYRDMRSRHDAAFQARRQEQSQARADAQGARNAIYEKYASALDAIYHPKAGPRAAAPDRSASAAIHQHLARRRVVFDRREGSIWGRFQNARALVPGASLLRTVRLAINPAERRRLFEREQRQTQARMAPPRGPAQPKERAQAHTPDRPHHRAAAVKAMRTAELADHARQQAAVAASMSARHEFQQEAERAQQENFKGESKAAWQAHRETFAADTKARETKTREQDNRPTPSRQASAAPARAEPRPEAAPPEQESKADRFGRSRDRKPRQPRAGRGQAGGQTEGTAQGEADRQTSTKGTAEAENRPVEAVEAADLAKTSAGPEATHAPEPGQGEGVSQTPAHDEAAQIRAERFARLTREAEASRDRDPGREMR